MNKSSWTVDAVLEEWLADRKLSRRKKAFLNQFHQHQLNNAAGEMMKFLPVAPAHICEALDLPNASTWAVVVAELLDFDDSEKSGHKVTTHTWQLENGTTEEPPVSKSETKIVNELNVLNEFISLKRISSLRKLFLMNNHDERLGNMEYLMVHGGSWKGTFCPDGIIKGLNDLAKEKGYPKELNILYPYYDLAVPFALDLIKWIESDEILESELTQKTDQINEQMNYFGQEFEAVFMSEAGW